MCCQVTSIQKDGSSQHSRATSPRRLIKQVALESPPTNASDELSTSNPHQQTTTLKIVSHEIKSDKSNAKEESYLTQRQRFRKSGPFAVDSQQIPDVRIKYAGAWPPPDAAAKDETENQLDENDVTANDHYSAEPKQVGSQFSPSDDFQIDENVFRCRVRIVSVMIVSAIVVRNVEFCWRNTVTKKSA